MTVNFRCDYCGETYETLVELCKGCGQYRIFDLRNNQPTALYNRVGGWEPRLTMADIGNEIERKKFRAGPPGKESKDLKAKRTSPVQVDGRRQNRR